HDVANRYRWVAIREYVQNVHRRLILIWQCQVRQLAKTEGRKESRDSRGLVIEEVGVARLYIDLIHAGRLFFFQLNRIVLEADHQPAAAPAGNGSRWQRALRLVCRRIITHARRSPPALEFDVASFHTLTMLSLVYRARITQLRYDIEIKQGKDESNLGRFTIRWKVVVCGDRGIEVVSSRELDVERESFRD
ncbi:hypothetical protein Gohar_019297, partial [Gossypium harknessii]|nr:hypothetical protein [Gossypium harknessii]